ncbi:MAG: hypothetical protein U0401_01645 [Anaerolineae bacterium]
MHTTHTLSRQALAGDLANSLGKLIVCIIAMVIGSAYTFSQSFQEAKSQDLFPNDQPTTIEIVTAPHRKASYVYHSVLQSPESLEFGPDGNLYVADWLARQIVYLTPSGQASTVIYHNLGNGARDIAFANNGTLYFNDHQDIYAVVNGSAVWKGHSNDIINRIAFGPDGYLYFTERISGNVRRLLSDGTTQLITTGLGNPDDLIFNAAGDLLVAESTNQRIVKVKVNTGQVTPFASAVFSPEVGDPIQLALESDGDLWAHSNGTLFQFNNTGAIVPYTLNGWEPSFALGNPPGTPGGIAFDGQGNLWVGDSPAAKLVRIEPLVPGGPITNTATITLVIPGFSPSSIAVGPNGDIFAAHSKDQPLGPGQILRITPTGQREVFTTLSGVLGGMTIDAQGNIFVSQTIFSVGHKIVKISPQGVASNYVTNFSPVGHLTMGRDGYLYAFLAMEGKIVQITAAETYSDFYTGFTPYNYTVSITAAPQGGLYVVNGATAELGYIPETGHAYTVIAFDPSLVDSLTEVTVTPSGDIFYMSQYQLMHATPQGAIRLYAIHVFGDPDGLVPSLDGGSVYVTRGGSIDRIPVADSVFLPVIRK